MNKRNLLLISTACFALATSSALMAQEASSAQDTPVVPMLSGGVGEDEMAELKSVENQYNLKLLFTATAGDYLSDLAVKITDAKGHSVVDTVSSGPVFLATLPPGKYTVQATTDDNVTVKQRVNVSGKTLSGYQIRFNAK